MVSSEAVARFFETALTARLVIGYEEVRLAGDVKFFGQCGGGTASDHLAMKVAVKVTAAA